MVDGSIPSRPTSQVDTSAISLIYLFLLHSSVLDISAIRIASILVALARMV
ncbi:MAG: hypothetical protein WCB98_03820 [Candidatus Aquirickettsiella gammari]